LSAIDGGIITSGTIQLAGDKNAVWAGISGKGTDDDSIRFWAGASTENRDTAPFRVNQAGEVYGRTRIEVEGVDPSEASGYKGQAGLAGSETEDKTGIRIYAGSDWDGKETAPFRVDGAGYMRATKGKIGGLTIAGPTLTNMNEDGTFDTGAQLVFRDDPNDVGAYLGTNVFSAGLTSGLLRLENNQVKQFATPEGDVVNEGVNIAARFEASGARDNYALMADQGVSHLGALNVAGQSTIEINAVPGTLYYVDPTKFSFIVMRFTARKPLLTLVKENAAGATYANPLRDGNRVQILAVNNTHPYDLHKTIRSNTDNHEMPGGSVVSLIYHSGAWYVENVHDNNY
jgi:hypothetical protein